MGRYLLERPSRWEVLIGVSHYEKALFELTGRLFDVLAVPGKTDVASNVHWPGVRLGFTKDYPFRQRLSDTTCLGGTRLIPLWQASSYAYPALARPVDCRLERW
jgi:hypothetical protein